jgi:hypothetical protein
MTPAQLIADLDAALARTGETVIVRRYTAPSGAPRPKTDVTGLKASVRAVKADDLVGDVKQTHSKAVLSPTGLSALLPLVKGDKLVIQGRERNIDLPKPIYVQDTLVRLVLFVAG